MKAENGKGEKSPDKTEASSGLKNLKKEMIKAVKAVGRAGDDVSGMVRKKVFSALQGKGVKPDGVKQVIKDMTAGALGAAEEIEIGLAATSRKVARGVIMGTHDAGADTTLAAGYAVKYAIRQAALLKGDVGQVAIATFDGAVEAVQEMGGDLETTARAVIAGAIESASAIGRKSGKKIRVGEYLRDHISRNHKEIRRS